MEEKNKASEETTKNNESLSPQDIIMSEDYLDLITNKELKDTNLDELDIVYRRDILNNFSAIYVKAKHELACEDYLELVPYYHIPYCFGLSSIPSLEASGIGAVLRNDSLDLRGKGVLVGVIDTGINYKSESFIYEDGTTKIESIWDQTIKGTHPKGFVYGAEYNRKQINEALKSKEPYTVVPSKDDIGHGSFVAGLAAGRNVNNIYSGAAPEAELVIVKLKQMKKCLRHLYLIDEKVVAYQSLDILFAIKYLLEKADELKKPIAIVFAGETNQGSHDGTSYVEEAMGAYGKNYGVAMITSVGNEGGSMHHYRAKNIKPTDSVKIDLNIGKDESGFIIFMYSNSIAILQIEIIAPDGESSGKIPLKNAVRQNYNFSTGGKLTVEYASALFNSVSQGIMYRLANPIPGLWRITVYGKEIDNNAFDVWLPIKGFIEDDTFFLQPDPYVTVTTPGTNAGTVSVGAYDNISNSLYIPSGRGYTKDDRVKPDLVAPGVQILGPSHTGDKGTQTMSGTSVSAAITAGASALLLQWGILKGNFPNMNTLSVNTFLRRSAHRKDSLIYPNREWGFGSMNLINFFTETVN